MRDTTYRADVDGLRAVAVLAVLVFHLFPALARGGFVGVDIFFVISGFLISSILLDDLDQGRPPFMLFRRFYARRVRRIFPALLTLLFAVWAAGWVVLLSGEYARLGKHIAGGSGFVANLLYWSEAGYFDLAASAKPLLHLWSLGVEEQFYLVWPLLLLLIWRQRRLREVLLLLLLAASFAASMVAIRHDAAAAFYSPVDRFWELLIGAVLAVAARDARATSWWQPQERAHDLCAWLGATLIAVAVVHLDGVGFPGWKALIPVGGAALIIAAGPRAWLNRRILSLRPAVWLGLISYPLYLWHWPLFSFARIVGGDLSTTARLAIAAASVVLAAATYWLIERPIRTRPATAPMVSALCVLMVVAASIGLTTFWRQGYPRRLPDAVRQFADFTYDNARDTRPHECLLFPERGERVFGPSCLDSDPARAALGEIVLWGDSHAAHLYPGIRRVYHDAFRISELTAGGCPPLLDVPGGKDSCPAITSAGFAAIVSRRPAIVVMGAEWVDHDWRQIPKTIKRLQAAGVGKVIVVGEVPVWDGMFPEILARLALNDRPRFRIPARTTSRLYAPVFDVDREMAPLVRQTGATYESTLAILCNDAGCLSLTGDDAASVTTWDGSHFTAAGSAYVVERFQDFRRK